MIKNFNKWKLNEKEDNGTTVMFEPFYKMYFNDNLGFMIEWLNANWKNKRVYFIYDNNILKKGDTFWEVDHYGASNESKVHVYMVGGQHGEADGLIYLDPINFPKEKFKRVERPDIDPYNEEDWFEEINEELKRKLSPIKLRQQLEDDEREKLEKLPLDFFTPEEIKILKSEDFDIPVQKEAKLVDKYLTYVIKKSLDLNDEVLFTLTITDNKTNEVIYDRKIKVNKRSLHKDTLDFMIDKCAYIEHNMKEKAMKSIDPYDEENWDDDEKDQLLKKKSGLTLGGGSGLIGSKKQ